MTNYPVSPIMQAIFASPCSPKDPLLTSVRGQATGTPASSSPSSQSSPSDSNEGRSSPDHDNGPTRANRNGVRRQGRKSATQLQNILAELDPAAYTRAQLMQKGLAVGDNELSQIVRAHIGIDLSRCPP